jgi:sec-independent protein translocase protein TatA
MLNSPVDIAIVFGIALLVFGPKKLPELGKALGQGIGNFKKSLSDAQEEVKSAINADEKKGPLIAGEPSEKPQVIEGTPTSSTESSESRS